MGNKTLFRLLIALGIIGVIAAILHFAGGGGGISRKSPSTAKKKVFANFPINDVASVTIKKKEGSLTLSKGEKSWEVKERDGYTANVEPIASMLKSIWDLNIGQPVTIGRSQYGRLQLVSPDEAKSEDEAASILTFKDAEDKELASLWLGKTFERADGRPSPMGGTSMSDAGRYVKPGTTNSVYLVSETFDGIDTDPAEWIDKTFFEIAQLKTIELAFSDGKEGWKLKRDDPNGDLVFSTPKPNEKLDSTKVASMRSAFSRAQMEDVLTGDALKETKANHATFKIATFEGFTYEIALGEKNDLNELPMTLKVDGKFEEKRKAGEEESDEEKERLDKQFTDELKRKKDKLAQEKSLEGNVFKIRSFIIDSILKKRSELLAEEVEEGEAEVAPGVTLPGLPSGAAPIPAPAPKAQTKGASKATKE
ncbi:MAG: DUF4340 domain-containing protein [Verrucomicrobiales bacterium]